MLSLVGLAQAFLARIGALIQVLGIAAWALLSQMKACSGLQPLKGIRTYPSHTSLISSPVHCWITENVRNNLMPVPLALLGSWCLVFALKLLLNGSTLQDLWNRPLCTHTLSYSPSMGTSPGVLHITKFVKPSLLKQARPFFPRTRAGSSFL